MAKIHTIAVFISHIYGDYQRDLCQGVIDKASQYGYHVDIFVSNDEKVLGNYSKGEFSILKIPNAANYDGVITSTGTYLVKEIKDRIIEELQTWNCPVVDINTAETPFARVLLDNNIATKEIVEHLVKVHNFTRIVYLGCTEEEFVSKEREHYYREAMTDLDLKDHIIYTESDFSQEGIMTALDKLLLNDPQAIICYNDQMASTVIAELASKGVNIPCRVAVTGCDNLEFGQNINPSLTTVTFPAYELGEKAFDFLLKKLDDPEFDEFVTVNATPIFRNSCGCHVTKNTPPILYSYKLKSKIDQLERVYLSGMRMSSILQGVKDLDVGVELIDDFVRNVNKDQGVVGLREFYLCLYSEWDRISSEVKRVTHLEENLDKDKIFLKLARRDGVRLSECTFSKKDSLPDYIRNANTSSVYVFTPLFFGEKSYGYICQAYENNIISYPFPFVSWLSNLNSMFHSIRSNKNMQIMLDRLEEIYSHDALTGLLNLQTFNMKVTDFIKKAAAEGKQISALVLDLDYLKKINDKFGHAEGNFAIQILGQAISQVLSDDLIACRFGGDEFYILCSGLSEEETQNIIYRIQKYLENYNETSSRPFKVMVSGGYAFLAGYETEDVDEGFKAADKNMYAQKEIRHRKFGDSYSEE
ncbi:MAG: GGDEF domain-containing protein [Acetatifactor sp.]|nr:GGDEF domain-containing protein [Acetatifactor sp.]